MPESSIIYKNARYFILKKVDGILLKKSARYCFLEDKSIEINLRLKIMTTLSNKIF